MFYVGDAAGREGDHSPADINFAYNANIKFYTETQYFLGKNEVVEPVCPKIPKETNTIKYLKEFQENSNPIELNNNIKTETDIIYKKLLQVHYKNIIKYFFK